MSSKYKPYVLCITIKSATNLPAVNLTGGSSDPYIILKVSNSEQFKTKTILENLNPIWNEKFQFYLSNPEDTEVEFHLFDHNDKLSDKLMGIIKYQLKNIPIDVEKVEDISFPSLRTGSLQFTVFIQSLIQLKSIIKSERNFDFPHVLQEFISSSTPTTVQQAFIDGNLLQLDHLTWSKFRDLLNDANNLFLDFEQDEHHYDPQSTSITAFKCKRNEYDLRFTRSLKIDLKEHTYSTYEPLPRFTITFQTSRLQYHTINTSNKFVMWKIICEIRRRYYYIERQRDSYKEGRVEHRFHQMYDRYYWPEPEKPIFNSFNWKISYYRDGNFNPIELKLESNYMDFIFPEDTLRCEIGDIDILYIGCEYPEHQSSDLRMEIISGQIDPQAFTEAQIRAKQLLENYNSTSSHSKSFFGVLKGVLKGTKNLVKGGSGVLEGSSLYLDIHGNFIRTDIATGSNPCWNSISPLLKVNEQLMQSSHINQKEPLSVMFHLVSETSTREPFVLGSKVVRLSDITPLRDFSKKEYLQDIDFQKPSILKSYILENTIELDQDIALRIDVIKGINLTPNHDFKLICSYTKIDGIVKRKYKQYTSDTTSNSSDINWNHTFILPSADGLFYASFVTIILKDESKRGKNNSYGAVHIPISDFYHPDCSLGGITKSYKIIPIKKMTSLFFNSLGILELKIQLLITPILQTKSIPTIDVKTQLQLSNEYVTSWLCYSLNDPAGKKNSSATAAQEKFLFSPSFDAIILEKQQYTSLDNNNNNNNNNNSNNNQYKSPLIHFQRKKRYQSSTNSNITIEEIEFNIFENQRISPLGSWSSSNLLIYERKPFTDESGTIESPIIPYEDNQILPNGFKWIDDINAQGWLIEKNDSLVVNILSTDNEGWVYGSDFGEIMKNYRQNKSITISTLKATRRRKWKRTCIREINEEDILSNISNNNSIVDDDNDYDNDNNYDIDNDDDDDNDNDDDISIDDTQDDNILEGKESNNEHDHDILVIDVYQNHRNNIINWGPSSLLGERREFSDESGTREYASKDHVFPPNGYEWFDEEWVLDFDYANTDPDGWCYGVTFNGIGDDLKNGTSYTTSGGYRNVRRRKYIRKCLRVGARISPKSNLTPRKKTDKNSNHILSKSEAYHKNRDHILKLCKERENLISPVIIPWDQVVSIDLVTPSVLAIVVKVHRYMEDGNGKVIYHEVKVEIFIVDCPAEKLCLLIKNRIHFVKFRNDVKALLSAGTMTGEDGIFIDYSDSNSNDPVQELSLGSTTIIYLEKEIMDLQSSVLQINNNNNNNRLQILESLELHKARSQLYISALLGSCLIGPSFNVDDINLMIQTDLLKYTNFCNDCVIEAPIAKFQEKIKYLFYIAESRIRDFALCGWSHRGSIFEECLRVLINKFYSKIVQEFTKLVESNDLQDNESKLAFFQYFAEYDNYLDVVTQNSLKYYNICLEPQPIISHCLDLRTLLNSFAENIKKDMLVLTPRAFQCDKTETKTNEYKLPWEVITANTYISSITYDLMSVLTVYLNMGHFNNISKSLIEYQNYLNSKIRLSFIYCLITAAEYYYNELTQHNWILPYTKINSESNIPSPSKYLHEHIKWICSVINDCQLLLQSDYLTSFNPEEQFIEEFNSVKTKLLTLVKSITDIGLDLLCSIFFKLCGSHLLPSSLSPLSPLSGSSSLSLSSPINSSLYSLWSQNNIFVQYLDDFSQLFLELLLQKDTKTNTLKTLISLRSLEKLIKLTIEKINTWYVFMILQTNSIVSLNRVKFSTDDIAHIKGDYDSFIEYFNEISGWFGNNDEIHISFSESISSQFNLILHIKNIISEDYSRIFHQSVNDYTLVSQSQDPKDRLIGKKFLSQLFQLRSDGFQIQNDNVDNNNNNNNVVVDDDDDIIDENERADVNSSLLQKQLLSLLDQENNGSLNPEQPFDLFLVKRVYNNRPNFDFLFTNYLLVNSQSLITSTVTITSSSPSSSSSSSSLSISPSNSSTNIISPLLQTSTFFNFKNSSSIEQTQKSSFLSSIFSQTKSPTIIITHISLSNMIQIPDRKETYIEFSILRQYSKTVPATTFNPNWGDDVIELPIKQDTPTNINLICTIKCAINYKFLHFTIGTITIPLNELFESGRQIISNLPINCTIETQKLSNEIIPLISFELTKNQVEL